MTSNQEADGRTVLSTERKPAGSVKVSDKRIFTSEGDLRDDPKDRLSEKPEQGEKKSPPPAPDQDEGPEPRQTPQGDAGTSLETPFSSFVESLIFNVYVNLGMIQTPYAPDAPVDLNGAREMIDIIQMLKEKTSGNLTQAEQKFLSDQLAELKLAWVRKSEAS